MVEWLAFNKMAFFMLEDGNLATHAFADVQKAPNEHVPQG